MVTQDPVTGAITYRWPIENLSVTGALAYADPPEATDVLFNGASVMGLWPIEVKVWPDGWGYINTLIELVDGATKVQIDGQHRTYMAYGWITVLLS